MKKILLFLLILLTLFYANCIKHYYCTYKVKYDNAKEETIEVIQGQNCHIDIVDDDTFALIKINIGPKIACKKCTIELLSVKLNDN